MFVVFWAFLGCLCLVGGIKKNGIEEIYYWREVIYEDLPLDDNTYIGQYPYHIATNNDLSGIAFHVKSGLVITTVARLRPGVPSTLNAFCAADYSQGTSPHIWGFPNYEKNTLKASFYGSDGYSNDGRKLERTRETYSSGYYNYFFNHHKIKDSSRKGISVHLPFKSHNDFSIIHVYRPIVDNRCNRLFVIDNGALNYGNSETYYVQSPAIIVFDLPTNGCEKREFPLIRRVEIPKHLWKDPKGFAYITLDYHDSRGSCDDIFLYISNTFDSSITVYDYKRGNFWVFTNPSMKPVIAESTMTIYNIQFEIPLGIMDFVLGWPDKDGDRNVYMTPGASFAEYVVSTKLLKNSKRAPYNYDPTEFTLIGYRGCDTQNFRQVIDLSTGVIFFGQMQSKKLLCWNIQNAFNPDTIGVLFESDALQFVSDMNIDSKGYLWFHSSHLAYLYLTEDTQLDISDVNSRTFRVKASEVIRGTVCDTSQTFRADL